MWHFKVRGPTIMTTKVRNTEKSLGEAPRRKWGDRAVDQMGGEENPFWSGLSLENNRRAKEWVDSLCRCRCIAPLR